MLSWYRISLLTHAVQRPSNDSEWNRIYFPHCELNVAKRLYPCIHYVMQVISGGLGFLLVCLQYYRPGKWLKFFINLNPCHNNYGQVAFSMPSYFVQSFCILFKLLKWHMFVVRQTGICNKTILKEWQF